MSESLKPYNPSEKGRELIALLFPLAHPDRQEKLIEYQKQYSQDTKALLDGFHFIIQEVLESRQAGIYKDVVDLPDPLLATIINQMLDAKNYFSYANTSQFFYEVNKSSPPVFKDISRIESLIKRQSQPNSAKKSSSDLPINFSEEIELKFKDTCHAAAKAYEQVMRIQRSLRNSQKVMDDFKNSSSVVSDVEFDLAKETFLDIKKVFLSNGKIIADGMKYVYEIYQTYPDELMVKKAYIKYLAKLLGSREARYPPENYVLNLAKGEFDFSLPDFEPTDRELQHGRTKYSIRKEYDYTLNKDVARLEARYRKRKLTASLKSEVSKPQIISELHGILKMDPGDIKTHIFLAKLMADYANSLSSHSKRGLLKEQALKHCQAAFSKIDDYLELQSIQEIKERDLARASFVKTISAIRIPLLRK